MKKIIKYFVCLNLIFSPVFFSSCEDEEEVKEYDQSLNDDDWRKKGECDGVVYRLDDGHSVIDSI